MYRFHVLGVPHTASNREWLSCAYTQKVIKLCRMLKARGHYVIHYGNETSDVDCDEQVTVTKRGELGPPEDYLKFDLNGMLYQSFYASSIVEIERKKQPKDFLLCMWGAGHRAVADYHSDLIVVEPGIGYGGGHFAPFKVFESYAMLSAYQGLQAVAESGHNQWYDVVIPNYFDPDDFAYSNSKDDYLLFLGRVYEGKGAHVAIEIAKALNTRLLIAGSGTVEEEHPSIRFIGSADYDMRRVLLSRAKALLAPSMFLEPFCGTVTEAHLSGTPAITSDWGAFAENNLHGITGYRCRTFEHFIWAVKNIGFIRPQDCRAWAEENFSMDRVADMYEEYWWSVMNIYNGRGWYQPNPTRQDLSWLSRVYP